MKKRFGKLISILCIFSLAFSPLATLASADTGPKPSVNVTFENASDELCYATLLSEITPLGPHSVWDGSEENAFHNQNVNNYSELDYEVWKSFVEYTDTDGYCFLQMAWQINETKELKWTYYPPSKFKILLYYPETDRFAISGIYERYAFDTYYTVDMNGLDIGSVEYNNALSGDGRIIAHRAYRWNAEFFGFIIRVIITIIIEIVIARLYNLLKKNTVLFLVIINVVTQFLLNFSLHFIDYRNIFSGYALCEFAIIAIEAIACIIFLKKPTQKTNKTYILYAFTANTLSYVAGLALSLFLPAIF